MRIYTSDIGNYDGQKVELYGWVHARRDHGKLIFIDLRDRSGLAQIVFGPGIGLASELRLEYVVRVRGEVKKRPAAMVNEKMPTGMYEVSATDLEIINKAEALPISVDTDGYEIGEEVRLRYRYLDLRRERLQKNVRLRHRVINHMRQYLDNRGFVEIETPIITKATPEGARDFLVPARLQPGKFYALPQSPQQYKQLLMVAGFEKYYQIARCFRDEDPRSDRAYGEFTQLDLEMSFTNQEEILNLIEELYIEIAEKVAGKKVLQKPFPRFTYEEAIRQFGADKFDLRKDGSTRSTNFPRQNSGRAAQASSFNSTQDKSPQAGDPNIMAFAWVVDFPLFETTATRALTPSHHPFTAPKEEDLPLLDTDPLKVRSWQHDLVCNGIEVGGGSIRITNADIQKKIFRILGHSEQEIEEKFGHLLEAFRYGVPPHGGIAPGIERLLMVLTAEENVREVVAFPMSAGGQTSVMDAPSKVDQKQLDELGLEIKNKIPKS